MSSTEGHRSVRPLLQAFLCLIVAGLPLQPSLRAQNPTDGNEFFEMRIRPLLASACFACHTDSQLGGLRVDSREALLKGGKHGPALLPGHSKESLLIRAVSHADETLKMPSGGSKLKDQEIADLEAWIQMGAPWPETKGISSSRSKGEYVIRPEQRQFWAFQPVRKPPLPKVNRPSWCRTPVDFFILSQLEAQGMKPVGPADKRTWLRRVTYDLIGLPPTPEEMTAFLKDASARSHATVVDRLLASPRYGERWARYWLDVVRYSDDRYWPEPYMEPFTNAFRYRDWVIKAFNDDMPYDLFIKAQVAGDLLELPNRRDLVAGTGLYALSPDYNDDRLDVTTRGFLGLTVACAQCHDHKFDPIPIQDYYSLQGIFNSTEPDKFPLAPENVVKEYESQKKKIKDQESLIKDFVAAQSTQLGEILAARTSEYLLAAWNVMGSPKQNVALSARQFNVDADTLERWIDYVKMAPKDHELLKPIEQLLEGPSTEPQVRQAAQSIQSLVLKVINDKKEIDRKNLITLGSTKEPASQVSVLSLERNPYLLWRDLLAESYGKGKTGVYYYGEKTIVRFLSGEWKAHLERMQTELAELKRALPPEYPFLHAIKDVAEPKDTRVLLRGNPQTPGDVAPRRFLAILSGAERPVYHKGSGRLELAESIANTTNPLTARVMVNRVWHYHFGSGLVRSLSNFGQLGDRPSHPELLDYLASRFVENRWSIKALHREIVLSATYALSAEPDDANFAVDPENRLLWRANRRRLDIESVRDSILAASGELDLSVGGPPRLMVDERDNKPAMGSQVRSLHPPPAQLPGEVNRRRTVYGYISRTVLDGMLSLFDFPNPNAPSEQRTVTTVPLQRLFLLNSRWMVRQSESFSRRLRDLAAGEEPAMIRRAYRILYNREPDGTEVRWGEDFLKQGSDSWTRYAQVLLSSNEFLYVD
jgi:cytochrome c553